MLNKTFTPACFILLAFVFLFSVPAPVFTQAAQSASAKFTAAEWQADLQFLTERMAKQHPNLFRRVKKEDFDDEVRSLSARIPSLTEDQIITGFMKVVAKVRDGHTNLYPQAYFRSGIFPLKFYLYSDGLFIQKAAPEYAGLVGAKVVRIGDLSAGEALKLAGTIAFSDNEMGAKDLAPVFLSVPELLAGLKINEDKQNLKLVIETGGKEQSVNIKPSLSLHQLLETPADWADAAGTAERALYRKHPEDMYWFEYLKDQKLLYVKHNQIGNKPDETVAAFYGRVMDFAAANPVDKFVIDLRNNGGGNNGLNRPVVIGLIKSKLDERGRLFVITGRQTFSAAQNMVNELEKYTKAIFVGEPTAGHPNHYGDNRPITLPNSKLEVRVSTLYWQDMDPRDDRTWTAPEIAVELSSADYRAGRDPALQAVIDYGPGASFADLQAIALSGGDISEFIAKYRAYKSDPKHRFVETQAPMNRFGYFLLQQKRNDDALKIFKLNVEGYPNSANVYDSLGDAFQAVGNKEEAIKSYEKALKIDPTYPSSLDQLKKLKQGP
ncbi:MAG TPA: tetratricopeptide repeat protein [Pyrinomonadaceae bacterium]|jgi:tetratricopeptide (TPR) repeat protein|nr:tetratricopeptide repeat protein [Pyrinomonadaceae bacterium]